MDKIKSQQLGVGDMLGEGWRLYRTNFRNILLVILCVYVPIDSILTFLSAHLRSQQTYNNASQLLESLVGILATIGIASIVENSIRGQSTTWRDSMGHAFSRWGSAIGTNLLGGLIVSGLMLLLIIPGIIWSVYYSFVICVVALRNMGGKTALDYSKNLVKGHWWRVLGTVSLILIIQVVVSLVIGLSFALISDNLFLGFIASMLGEIVRALFTVMIIVFFLNRDYLTNPSQPEPSPPLVVTA